jgi:hypothetical protein
MNQYRRHITETLGTDRPVHSIEENVRFYSTPIPEQSDIPHIVQQVGWSSDFSRSGSNDKYNTLC